MAQAGGAAAAAAEPAAPPARHAAGVSQRVQSTQAPCVVATKKLMAQKGAEGTLSLAQGGCGVGRRVAGFGLGWLGRVCWSTATATCSKGWLPSSCC